ncbi:MAG: C25 family cysteine peptidase, partial [Fidelibacterota bacterium]
MKKLLPICVGLCLQLTAVQAGEYLVIVHNQLLDNSWYQPFFNLKSQMGFNVNVLTLSDGQTLNDIKVMIESHSPPPDYVLLIGDASKYPETDRETVNTQNGNYLPLGYELMRKTFAWHYKDDYVASDKILITSLPDAEFGRLPAQSTSEITSWVNKMRQYHNFSSYSQDKNRALMVTDNVYHPTDGGSGVVTTRDRDSLINNYLVGSAIDTVLLNSSDYCDFYGSDYYQNQYVRTLAFEQEVNNGVALIYTMGIGASESFLSNFYFTPPYIECDWNFTNQNKYPFLLGISCSIGEIQDTTSNAGNVTETESVIEKLLFLPDVGIIGAFAPTDATFSTSVMAMSERLWERIVSENYDTYGELVYDAKAAFLEQFANTRQTREWEHRTYILYGDPSMPLALYQYKD